jgi:diguanylate cyclase (GGDEF)-like protein
MVQFNVYILFLLISALASMVLAFYTFRRQPSAGSRYLGWMLLALSEWSLTAALEGTSPLLPVKIFWTVLSYIGSQTTAVLFLLFVLRYTQQNQQQSPWLKLRFIKPWLKGALFIVPAISFIMAATNQWHGWLWPSLKMIQTDWIGIALIFEHGPWFWVELVYAYLLLTISMAILIRAVSRFPHLFAVQSRVLIILPLLPWLLSILYAFGSGTPRVVDLTPVAFTWTGIALAWSMFHYQFLQLVPYERDLIMDLLQEGILLVDNNQRMVEVNRLARTIFDLRGDPLGQTVQKQLSAWPEVLAFLNQETKPSMELLLGERWCVLNLAPWLDRKNARQGTLLSVRDISERRRAEVNLQSRERFLFGLNEITRAALEASDLQSMLQTLADRMGDLLNADGCYITLWDEVNQITIPRAAYGQLRGTYPSARSNPEYRTMTRSVLEAGHALAAEDVFNTPYMNPEIAKKYPSRSLLGLPLIAGGRKLGAALIGYNQHRKFTADEIAQGEQAAAQISLAVLKNHLLHEAQHASSQAETTNQQLQSVLATLELLATRDQLTGAYNRNKFDDLIHNELSRLDRYNQPFSLMMFDIDHFKHINDTYGHHTGDLVLAELAQLLKTHLRETDTLTRWGGEEFLILSPGIGLEQAVAMAWKIHNLVAEHTFPAAGHLTISLGVTEARPGDTPDDLLIRADTALYEAKDKGRSRVEFNG